MTYVTDQTSAELCAHMRKLKAMPGWHEPLADRLWKEVQDLISERDTLRAALQDKAGEVKCQTCNGHGLVGGHMQDGSGYGEGCPDCNPDPAPLVKWARSQQPAPVVPDDVALRCRVQDLLHLLSFAKIETPTPTDKPEAEKAMADIRAMITASQQKGGQ